MQTNELAALMGVTESDLLGFLGQIVHFMERGASFDEAIRKTVTVAEWACNNAVALAAALKPQAAEWVYEAHGRDR